MKKIYKNITNIMPGFKNMVNALLRYYKVKKNKNITKQIYAKLSP